jgi:hypothetical protein
MLKRYNTYIREKYQYDLILLLEGVIYSTDGFLSKLKSINNSGIVGDIAEFIFDMIDGNEYFDDKLIKQNFFNTTDKEDMVSFLPNSKIGDSWDSDEEPELPYTMKGRGEVKIGKIIRYLIDMHNKEGGSFDVKDKDIEAFVNAYKASKVDSDKVFKLVSGEDIIKYYNKDNYAEMSGQLGNSCMAGKPESYFDIYSENPNINMLIYVDNNDKIHGRAIVWKVDKSPCGSNIFMDRVYTIRDSDAIKFKKYAEKNDWFYKRRNSYGIDEAVGFIYKGEDIFGEVVVKLKKTEVENFPFMDTLMFFKKDNSKASNITFKGSLWAQDPHGGLPDECNDCNGEVYIECYSCKGDKNVKCDSCDGDGKIFTKCVKCSKSFNKSEIEHIVKKYEISTGSLKPVDDYDVLETGDVCFVYLGDHGLSKSIIYKTGRNIYAIQGNADGSTAPNRTEWSQYGRYSWLIKGGSYVEDDHQKLHIYKRGRTKLKPVECDCNGKDKAVVCVDCSGKGTYVCNDCEDEPKICTDCSEGHIILEQKGVPTKFNGLKDKYKEDILKGAKKVTKKVTKKGK